MGGYDVQYRMAVHSNCKVIGPWVESEVLLAPVPPPAPTNFALASKTQTTATFTFTAPTADPPVTVYKIHYNEGSSLDDPPTNTEFFSAAATTGPLEGPYVVDDLDPGTQYTFAVVARNANGDGEASSTLTETTSAGVPGAPSLSLSDARSTEMDLSITVSNNGGATIDSILVYHVATGGARPTERTAAFVPAVSNVYTVTGLLPATAYDFYASAKNSVGEGAITTTALKLTTTARAPDAPAMITATMRVADATLRVTEGASTGGAPITSLNTRFRTNPSGGSPGTWSPYVAHDDVSTPYDLVVTGLSANTRYDFEVTLTNSAGTSAATALEEQTTLVTAHPTSLAAPTRTTSSVVLSWTNPFYIVGVDIRYQTRGGSSWTQLLSKDHASETYEVIALTPNTDYDFQIRSVYFRTSDSDTANHVVSDWSSTVEKSTTALSSLDPQQQPGSFTATAGTDRVSLSWTAVPDDQAGTGSTIRGYAIQGTRADQFPGYATVTEVDTLHWKPTEPTGTSIEHTGLRAGHTWKYRIRAVNTDGKAGQWAFVEASIAGGTPGAPELTATVMSASEITLSWTEPSAGTYAISGYELQRSDSVAPTDADFATIQSGTTRTRADVGLKATTLYSYRVRAANDIGPGAWSAITKAETEGTASAVPTAVRELKISTSGNDLLLEWLVPTSGAAPFEYVIQRYDNGAWQTPGTTQSETEYRFTGASVNTNYRFRVAAKNTHGQGPWEEVSGQRGSKADRPNNVQATRAGTVITVTWDQPGTVAVTGYAIQVRIGDAQWFLLEDDTESPARTYEHRATDPTVRYRYRVASINGAGRSIFNPTQGVDVPAVDAPANPTNLRATRSGTTINLTWDAPTEDTPTSYLIQRAEGATGAFTTIISNTGNTLTTYSDQGLNDTIRYRYRVAANSAGGTSGYSNVADVQVVTKAPGKVPGLRAGRQHPNMLLTWNAPPGPISGYKVEVSRDEGPWSVLTNNTASQQTRYLHVNVRRSVPYRYRVSAINSAGTGPPSDIVSSPIDLSAPSAPPGVRALREHPEIKIDWDLPQDDGGLLITGYRVEYAVGNGEWATLVESNPHNSYVHEPTDRGLRYRYRIYAINSHGVSPPSTPVEVNPNLARPSPPRDVRATIIEGNVIEISWIAPADDGGSAITGYRIEYREATRTAWLTLNNDTRSPSQLNIVHRNTQQGTEYEYRVAAINPRGVGDWSAITNAVTADVPGPPRLQGVGLDSKIELQWDAPVRTGGEEIISYRLEVSGDQGLTWITLAEVGEHVRGYTHDRLGPGIRRTYRIRARNALGEGTYSNVVTLTTRLVKASMPRDLQARVLGQDVELVWLEPHRLGGGRIVNYRVEISVDSRVWELVTTGATGNRYVVTGLDADVERFFRIAAVTEAGTGEFSGAVKVKTDPTVPDPPNVVTALALNSTTISIAWNPPKNTGGRFTPLIGYRIELFQGSQWVILRSNTRSLETQYTHSGLEPGTEYHYRIRALNRVGASEPSEDVYARTHAVIPGPPTGVTVHAEGSDRLRVRWNAPRYDGGGKITGYQIEANRVGVWKVLEPNTRTPQLDYLHVGLQPAQTWSYRISAINEAGLGEPSIIASGETHPIVPDPPTGLRAEADGDKIELRWKPPDYTGGIDLIGYRIEASRDRASWEMLVRNSGHTGTTFTHEDLPPASTWYYRVYSINEQGISQASQHASATTEAVEPGAPESLVASSPNPETVVLEWDKPPETGGAPIMGYRIQFSEDEGLSWETLEHNTNDTERRYVHSGRKPATIYWYRVFAINRIGVGPASTVVSVRTQARVSDPPMNLVASPVTPDQIDLMWDPPEYDGGAEIEHYRIEHTLHPEEDWELLAESERSEWSHEDLTPGETHHYRVRAVNRAGISEPSNMAEATTDDTADRIERLNKTILPRFASTVASGVVKSISDRLEAIAHDRGGHRQIGSIAATERGGIEALLNGASASESFGSKVAAWGSAEKVQMNNVTDDMRWEGDVLSVFTGSDVKIADGLFLGLSGSHSVGNYDITDFAWDEELEADYGVGMTTITPYIGWMPKQNVTAWTSGSYSFGEIRLERGPTEFDVSRTTMMMGAGGLIGRLISGQMGGINLRTEGWIARLNVKEAENYNPVVLDLRRVRTALEWQRLNLMNGQHEFMLLVNTGLRHDFNVDLQNHSGFEFGGGAGYTSPSRRLRITVGGRMLVTTDADYGEWGFGGSFFMEPSREGGLAIRAEPRYGSHESGVEQLWHNGVRALTDDRAFTAPISFEYHRGNTRPYLRLAGDRVALGTRHKGISIEWMGGTEQGLSLGGQWRF